MYDYIVIGSSPVCMIEAMTRHEHGERVAIIEGSSQIGGAWGLVDVFGWENVEISAHIMRDWQLGYHYLEDTLGIELEKLMPQPSIVMIRDGKPLLRYNYNKRWKSEAIKFLSELGSRSQRRELLQHPRRRLIAPILSILQHLLHDAKAGFPKIYYPTGGTRNLIETLAEKCSESEIDLITDEWVGTLDVDSTEKCVTVACHGRTLKTRQLGFTRNSVLSQVRVDGKKIAILSDPLETTHAHFLVGNTERNEKFTFLNFKNDFYFHMVSDVTKYATPSPAAPPGARIFATWLNADSITDDELAEIHFDHLRQLDLLPKGATLIDWQKRRYTLFNLHNETLDELCSIDSNPFQYLETGDLTLSMQDYSNRWN